MWELDYSGQVYTLLLSLFTGAVFCLVFDFYTAVRLRLKFKKLTVFIFDILIFIAFGIFDFCFFLARTGGEIRGYVFTGQIIGFIICKQSLSKIFDIIIILMFSIIKRLLKLLKKFILSPIFSIFHQCTTYF